MTFSCEQVGLEFFDTAPTRYHARQEIAATPDEVFAVFLDGPSWVKWALPITGIDWTSGFPIEVGSTRTVHMRGGLIGYEEFIAYDHGRRMAFRFNEASKGGIIAFAEDYQVTELSPGRCVVEWTMAMQAARESRLASKITDPIMSFMVTRMLRKFAKVVESSPGASPG